MTLVERPDFVYLPLSEIRGMSAVGQVPGPDKVVDEHILGEDSPFRWGTLLIPK